MTVTEYSLTQPTILERSRHPISRRDIDPNVLKVLYRLINARHLAYLVGGGVRDLMMGRRPKDFDVATSAHPHEVRELFRNSRLIGRRFRLVHVFFGPQNIEVATFRRRGEEQPETDDPMIRHDNTFGTPEEDAFRRDFTINALFYDPRTFQVIDYAGGVADLDARLIRTVGEPEIRMREDPVRMLRAVRFAGKLGFSIEPATYAAIIRFRHDLAKSPPSRLAEETYRTLDSIGAAKALTLMAEMGLLEVLLPTLSEHLREAYDPASAATVRNMAALVRTMELGEPSRGLILAALFADLYLVNARGAKFEPPLLEDLRRRGFSRADTEQMRLLLDALPHLLKPSRVTRRLTRRPYFPEAMRLFEMLAPTYGGDIAGLERLLKEPPAFHARGHRGDSQRQGADQGTEVPGKLRRRHRGGRRRSRAWRDQAGASNGTVSDASASAAAPPSPLESHSKTASDDKTDDC
ncbi:MAG: polynucleotide adenylyltransferase PcnB [Candidatus Binataceae bacterium]